MRPQPPGPPPCSSIQQILRLEATVTQLLGTVARLDAAIQTLIRQEKKAMSVLDDKITALTSSVENETSVDQSAVKLILGIPDLIGQAVAQALAAGATAAQLQSLTDLQSKIANNSSTLSAAVTANTPAAPPA